MVVASVVGRFRLVYVPRFALTFFSTIFLSTILISTTAFCQETASAAASANTPATPETLDQIIDRVVEQQHLFVAEMRHYHPLVETYIQNLQSERNGVEQPVSDQYFLGRLELADRAKDSSLLAQTDFGRRILSKLTTLYELNFLPLGFAQMAILDDDFQRKYYNFTFARREFLGEIRCLVLDVQPKTHSANGRFLGRIWVEDQHYNIVRFEGTYLPRPRFGYYLHFDSWRLNLRPGVWFPAYIYSEELPLKHGLGRALRFKAQTRLWGYEPYQLKRMEEFTHITIDSPGVDDQGDATHETAPGESKRLWEGEAEDNAIERLQNVGLIAPQGDADKILQTVVSKLLVPNKVVIQPDVRVRVLLLSPLQSFTIGHTIVLSRGLLDVLPDDASLGMILAHELAHIILGHSLDTKFAFSDRLLFPDDDAFERLDFVHTPNDEDAADKKAAELLANSPYKDDLASAGLFLKMVRMCAPELKGLIRPHIGNSLANGKFLAMSPLLASAAQPQSRADERITVMPLGSRVELDPWSNRIELMKTTSALTSAQKELPFEVAPFPPHLTRLSEDEPNKMISTAPLH